MSNQTYRNSLLISTGTNSNAFLRISMNLMGTVAILTMIFLLFHFFGFTPQTNHTALTDDSSFQWKNYPIGDSIYFTDIRIPTEKFDVRESLDRELHSVSYWHSNTLLLMKNAHRYFPVIEPILAENDIPDDFKYLALAESNLQNLTSPAGAKGVWQFLNGTAKEFKLEISETVDERYHLEKSTQAACDYFNQAYKNYENWGLVAASYNMGQGALNNNIEFQKSEDYFEMFLNTETARYVYRIAAYKILFENPARFGFSIPDELLYPQIPFDTVMVSKDIENLQEFAEENNSTYKMVKMLNPWLIKRNLKVQQGKTYTLKMVSETQRTTVY